MAASYANLGAALIKAQGLASILDPEIMVFPQRHFGSVEATGKVAVFQRRSEEWVVVKDDGAGNWVEQ